MIDLYSPNPPWVICCPPGEASKKWNEQILFAKSGVESEIRVLRGKRMRRKVELMAECAAAFQFFESFGSNWDALSECLCYLDEWMPAEAYVVVVTNCQHLLIEDDPRALATLMKLLCGVAEYWAKPITNNGRYNRPSVPFHVILQCPPDSLSIFQRRPG